MLHRLALRLRTVFRRRTLDREMREEMDAHLAQATARLMTRGLSLQAAQLEARREFGNVGVLHEEARDARGARWIESLNGDVRFALRHFSRRPLGTVTMVLILALGIGGHAAVFSVVQAYSTRPAPGVPRDDALVRLRAKERTRDDGRWFSRPFSYPELHDLSAMKDVFTSVAGWEAQDGTVSIGGNDGGGSEPAMARIYFVTDNYFATLGLPLTLGPGFSTSHDELSAIISDATWREQFGGRADVLGKVVRLNDVSVRIAGVAPPRFSRVTQNAHAPSGGSRVFWLPVHARSIIARTSQGALSNRDSTLFDAVGRLAAGVSIAQATAALKVATERADAQMTPRSWVLVHDADVVPLRGDTELPAAQDGLMVAAVGGSVALLVLLIACANVSALVVGAGIARRHEIAIRLSLGASRARVVRQLLTETTLLAMFAGALGLLVYSWIVKIIATQAIDVDLAPDLSTVVFTTCLALGTGILFGLSPALHATRHGVSDALKDSGAGFSKRSRLQRVFVVAQIVFSQPLLVGLAMLLGILVGGGEKPMAPGVEQHVLRVGFQIFVSGSSEEKRIALERFRTRVEQLPGVVDVVPAAQVTLGSQLMVHPADRGSLARASEPVGGTIEGTSPGYFRILDIPILRGRELVAGDTNVAIIGDDLARTLWGAADPIGRRFQQQSVGRSRSDLVVVGVYDSRFATTRGSAVTRVYVPFQPTLNPQFLIRTSGPAAAAIEPIRAIARQEAPSLPIGRAQSLEQTNEAMRNDAWQAAAAAAGAGLLALLLASIGLYGVVALAVGQRKREIGIRMALGARPRQVATMLFASGVRLSIIGLLLGVPFSLVALRMLATQARMPETSVVGVGFGIVAVVLAVSSLATWIPARHASTIDPAMTLRSE
jgi:predicted permease